MLQNLHWLGEGVSQSQKDREYSRLRISQSKTSCHVQKKGGERGQKVRHEIKYEGGSDQQVKGEGVENDL